MIQVEKNIPLPEPTTQTRTSKYPWKALAVSESFFVPDMRLKSASTLCYANRKTAQKSGRVVRFKCAPALCDGQSGVRIWRIE